MNNRYCLVFLCSIWVSVVAASAAATGQNKAVPYTNAGKIIAASTNSAALAQLKSDVRGIRDDATNSIATASGMTATNFPAGGQRSTINAIEAELKNAAQRDRDISQALQDVRRIVAEMQGKN